MSPRRRKPVDAFGNPIDPTEIYCSMSTLATADPALTLHVGDRLRGDHQLVRDHAHRFVPDGTPRSEWPPDPDIAEVHAVAAATSKKERTWRRTHFGAEQTVLEPPEQATLTVTRRFLVRFIPGEAAVEFKVGDRVLASDYLLDVAGDYVTPTVSAPRVA